MMRLQTRKDRAASAGHAAPSAQPPRRAGETYNSMPCVDRLACRSADRVRLRREAQGIASHEEKSFDDELSNDGPSDDDLAELSTARHDAEHDAEHDASFGDIAGDEESATHSADAFESYLRDLGAVALLTPAEELTLAKRSLAGDLGARQRLIEANLRLVIANVRRFSRSGVPLADLVQEGNLGLMRAAAKFDWRRGYRFSTYATWWIHQSVRRAAHMQSRLIRVPDRVVDRMSKARRIAAELAQESGYDPSPAQIAARSGMPIEEVAKLLRLIEQPLSLDVAMSEDDARMHADTLIDLDVASPEESATQHLLTEALRRALLQLTPQERVVLALRFGLSDGRSRTCGEISRQIGVSRHRAMQFEAMALDKLRRALTQWSSRPAV